MGKEKMQSIQSIKGFADLFSNEARIFTWLESTARKVFGLYQYEELRTPLVEFTDLFKRSIGMETDVVQKEMYTFPDSKGRMMSLRPEATAGVMRAYIEAGIREPVSKFFTIGPMFRHERPQKGRMRQFHQINAECLGPMEPEVDAEAICMLMDFLTAAGLSKLTLQINSLGCQECRPAYKKLLQEWLLALAPEALCEDCQRRIHTNPLRVLDCKVPTCKEHLAKAPLLLEHNCPECRRHFDAVVRLLTARNVPFELNYFLVRGLDYYMRTTFEVVSGDIGAQGSVAGGGRYDGLIASLGGPEIPGIGFACGMERLTLLLENDPRFAQAQECPDFYAVALTDAEDANAAQSAVFNLCQDLRTKGFSGSMGFQPKSAKNALRQADKLGARFVLLIGPEELEKDSVTIKHMASGSQALCAWQSQEFWVHENQHRHAPARRAVGRW